MLTTSPRTSTNITAAIPTTIISSTTPVTTTSIIVIISITTNIPNPIFNTAFIP